MCFILSGLCLFITTFIFSHGDMSFANPESIIIDALNSVRGQHCYQFILEI